MVAQSLQFLVGQHYYINFTSIQTSTIKQLNDVSSDLSAISVLVMAYIVIELEVTLPKIEDTNMHRCRAEMMKRAASVKIKMKNLHL